MGGGGDEDAQALSVEDMGGLFIVFGIATTVSIVIKFLRKTFCPVKSADEEEEGTVQESWRSDLRALREKSVEHTATLQMLLMEMEQQRTTMGLLQSQLMRNGTPQNLNSGSSLRGGQTLASSPFPELLKVDAPTHINTNPLATSLTPLPRQMMPSVGTEQRGLLAASESLERARSVAMMVYFRTQSPPLGVSQQLLSDMVRQWLDEATQYNVYTSEQLIRRLLEDVAKLCANNPEPNAVRRQLIISFLGEHPTLLADYFKRYDYDNSGVIDSHEELKQLTVNLLFILKNLGLVLPTDINSTNLSLVEVAVESAESGRRICMALPEFQQWFTVTVLDIVIKSATVTRSMF